MKKYFFTLSILFGAISTYAHATSVQQVPDIATLKMGGVAFTNVNVDAYSSVGDGGGGEFIKGANCSTGDDGVIIKENDTNHCWYRQFSGPVHINWYGITPTNPSVTAAQFGAAFDAARTYGNRTVLTDGVAINYTGSVDLDIPTGDTLDCQGTIGGVSGGGWTIPTLPSSIILVPPFKIAAHARSALKNCNIRPSWFTGETPTETVRDLIAILRQFSGTGVECTDDGCSILNVAVYGFDTGIRADESQRFYMNNVVVDANVGIWWRGMAGASKNTNLLVDPVITQGSGSSEEDWSVTSVSADSNGECKLTLGTSPSDLHTDADTGGSDIIWVYGIGGTFAIDTTGTTGGMTISDINPDDLIDVIPGTAVTGSTIPSSTTVTQVHRDMGQVDINNSASSGTGVAIHFSRTNTGPAGCNGKWFLRSKTTTPSYTVTLRGSSFAGPQSVATWKNGSRVMTVASLVNIAPGQAIQSGLGIPPSTFVTNILPATGANAFQVIVSNNATADELTPTMRSFANATPFAGDAGQLILSAAPRV